MRRFNWVLRHLHARRTFDSALGLRSGSQKLLFERYIHATGISCSSDHNYYDVLGVSPKATREEIKKSFHELAKKFHPDVNRNNPSAKKKFQEIREAYETLGNSERRDEYDKLRYRSSDYVNNDGGDAERFRRAYQSNFSDSFHKIFSEIFEGQTEQFESDIQVELSLSFSEAAKGCTKRLSFDAYVFCDSCDGLGHPRDAAMRVCPTCRGVGRVTIPPFTAQCQTCKGSGHIVKEYCMSCRGSGVVEATKTVELVIPGGVESEATIPIPGAGNVRSRTSQPGNLYIKLKVANDSTFTRDGSDIYVDANISFIQAIMGGKVVVPTLSGKIELNIPKGTQPGNLLVLRGKGLPKQGYFVDHGDQYVRFRVNFPSEVNERQRAILEEFAKEEINNELSGSSEESWWNRTGSQIIRDVSLMVLLVLLFNKLAG
ncbi:Chaperone protein dnaJ 1 [Cardamine amara subsp. amara]|uniref:Chaperone protein dnaJ 1 n=1 Tax=Cardamine amara subsp. amara TaxID=228776 RepID=A0ABD1BNI5_CARAN